MMNKTLLKKDCFILRNGDMYYGQGYGSNIELAKRYKTQKEARGFAGPNDEPVKIRIIIKELK